MTDFDVKKLEELLGNPVADIVLRRMLIRFKGTAEQLARNVKLDYIKYGELITVILEKLVKSQPATKRSYTHQDSVYNSIPNIIKKQVPHYKKFKKIQETGFIELRTRLK